ncbi:MAG: hypothetical protein QM743_04780 [Chitinophagaceae bacterium]
MKIALTLVSLFVFLSFRGLGQQDYNGYFRGMLTVQELIAAEDFGAALNKYKQLFSQYDRVFASDAFNACQLAAFSDTASFSYFYYHCARAGVPWKTLSENRFIGLHLPLSPDSVYLAGRKIFSASIDTALRSEFMRRYRKEQDSKNDRKEFAAVVADNFNRILALARKGRFPDERLIGTNDELENGMLLATLKHQPWSFMILQPYINQSIRFGGLQPIGAYYVYGFNQARAWACCIPISPVPDTSFL